MDTDETADRYFTYDGRLASFQLARRPPVVKGKASKALTWPHKELDPAQFAQAGFYFEPTPEAPDNTVCFLCVKAFKGWETNDNPLEEHIRLSPHCGWAIVAAIEAGLGDYGLDDPSDAPMVEARKATFAGLWPHEGKRGWKCKTKQLVEAGWKYTPTAESDDMATCTYCSLALDGWEPKDNPLDEHYKRSPDCQFFQLLNHYKTGPTKKKGRGKGARASQSSRLSAQSIATTVASDATSLLEPYADHDDSVMTTTSIMTQGGTKRGRTKKTTATKGKRTRAKKEEAVEVLEDSPEPQIEQAPPSPPPKATRGRKRASELVEDSVLTTAELPAAKKRATRTRKANVADTSVIDQAPDHEMSDLDPVPKSKAKGKKARSTTTRKARKASTASTISNVSLHEDAAHIMDDDELDRQLQADFDRPLSDDENIAADSDSDRKNIPSKQKTKKVSVSKKDSIGQAEASDDHAMFDPQPHVDEVAVEDELKALEAEMGVEQVEEPPVPKKGRKPGPKRVSKEAKKIKDDEPVKPDIETATADELAEGHDVSVVSNSTMARTSLASNAAPRKRGRPSKKASIVNPDPNPDELAGAGVEAASAPEPVEVGDSSEKEKESATRVKALSPPATSSPLVSKPPPQPPVELDEPQPPSTPLALTSPAPAAKQAALSPSQSPQASDAENEPPSSKPSNTANSARIVLAPVHATPVPTSPSKRNILFGLRSGTPWTAVDVDMIFDDIDKENTSGSAKFLRGGADLTSPEKRMTVEEWIYRNAEEAEKKLKLECETMVTAFEKEGTRAMQALEGLIVD
ncbi:uncharacterized protein F4812DRAFT_260472 [Daldinia caldariorum]|uniref:uncharacterized protein n=1 Tax=Daldinia caldariorum TaxID=326644 RepID=UPI0020087C2F|nr:uncharacterized protein F4812DRAFT_260472 [Daldinia caldariorum]KAI1470310.1 hypothetical protein F4812DRAFT_260472 [Daldinia caldariorum]